MDFKDYYATLGVAHTAPQDDIKRAYRKLARKYHPDVSKEPNAEARFKEVAEAHEALIDPERRAAYDAVVKRHASGQQFEAPAGWDSGFEFSGPGGGDGQSADFSDFFSSLFGRGGGGGGRRGASPRPAQGSDHHARLTIDLQDSFRGAQRTMSLRMPSVDAQGNATMQERQLEVNIPPGVREGQQLRLQGQGGPGRGGAPAGDLYLELAFAPHPLFRVDGRDLSFDLPISPWEAALGATVTSPTPDGPVQLGIPVGSTQGRKLRLKGRGLPGKPAGDLYAVLRIALPAANTDAEKAAYQALANAYPDHNPRATLEA